MHTQCMNTHSCSNIYVYIYAHIHTQTCKHINMSIRTHRYTYIHSYPNLHTCTHYTCSYAGIDSPIYTHGLAYFLICTYTCAQNTCTLYMSTSYTCAHTVLPSVWYEGWSLGHLSPSLRPSLCTHPSVHTGQRGFCLRWILMSSTVRLTHVLEKQLLLFVYFPINKPPVHQTL